MAKMEVRNEALRAATKEKIHSAATVLFARKGLAGTGVQEIADMADVNVGMLYRYYKTKDDIPDSLPQMAAVLLEYVNDLQDKIARLIERGQNDGTFRQGCTKGMASMFLAVIQGLCAWKLANKGQYAPPTPTMLTAFLLKEEYNHYD